MLELPRRSFLGGMLAFAAAAPAIVPVYNLMKLPRKPFTMTVPSGLWVKVRSIVTGLEETYAAVASNHNGKVHVKFDLDRLTQFNFVTIGRDENDLFYSETRDVIGTTGDSVVIIPSVE